MQLHTMKSQGRTVLLVIMDVDQRQNSVPQVYLVSGKNGDRSIGVVRMKTWDV